MSNGHNSMRIAIVLILAVLLGVGNVWGAGTTFAGNAPDVALHVTGDGSRAGPVFTDSSVMGGTVWAPGVEKSGTIRIYNDYSETVNVDRLGMTMKLERDSQQAESGIYDEYAKDMKLTIERGRMLVFNDTIFSGSFYDMLYESGSSVHQGYALSPADRFSIASGDHADLKYTAKMDEGAGNGIQGLIAKADLLVNMSGNTAPSGGDEDNNNHHHHGDDGENELVEQPEEVFPDIGGHWAHDCIVALLQHGVIQGYEDGTIRPDNYITRAETAVLVGKALGLKDDGGAALDYSDGIPDWARGYISSSTSGGVFTGYPDGTFLPGKDISREEMAAVLIRAFDKKPLSDNGLGFTDKAGIGRWAEGYVKAGVDNEIITGYPDNTFRPKNDITRAEAFTMICKLLGYHTEHSK